jgi:hypothetical protein
MSWLKIISQYRGGETARNYSFTVLETPTQAIDKVPFSTKETTLFPE